MSWIVTRLSNGEAVAELYDPRTVARVNRAAYRVEEAGDYLRRFNAELRSSRTPPAHR